jgi:hypothetical protein
MNAKRSGGFSRGSNSNYNDVRRTSKPAALKRRGARIENQIREAMGETPNAAAASRIVAAIKRLKLQPFDAPEPLPPIDVEEVELVCWMGVVA